MIIGSASAEREPLKLRNNINIGVSVARSERNKGLGTVILKETIARVKKEMRPKNIFLSVFANHHAAKKIYKKLGFKTYFVLPNWANHYGKYHNLEFMLLEEK
jgi:RimJ/RimL family protein N-acetyltransferase